jgi:hypothetical protein
MSASILQVFLLSSLGHHEDSPHSIDEVIRRQFDEAIAFIPERPSSGCLLTDIGDFLIHTSTLTSRLADGLVHGQHVEVSGKRAIQEMENEHDFSNLDLLEYMNKKHSLLRCSLHHIFIAPHSHC